MLHRGETSSELSVQAIASPELKKWGDVLNRVVSGVACAARLCCFSSRYWQEYRQNWAGEGSKPLFRVGRTSPLGRARVEPSKLKRMHRGMNTEPMASHHCPSLPLPSHRA